MGFPTSGRASCLLRFLITVSSSTPFPSHPTSSPPACPPARPALPFTHIQDQPLLPTPGQTSSIYPTPPPAPKCLPPSGADLLLPHLPDSLFSTEWPGDSSRPHTNRCSSQCEPQVPTMGYRRTRHRTLCSPELAQLQAQHTVRLGSPPLPVQDHSSPPRQPHASLPHLSFEFLLRCQLYCVGSSPTFSPYTPCHTTDLLVHLSPH